MGGSKLYLPCHRRMRQFTRQNVDWLVEEGRGAVGWKYWVLAILYGRRMRVSNVELLSLVELLSW